MSVLHFDKHTNSFLLGLGANLYQLSENRAKLLVKCGEVPETSEKEEPIKEGEKAPRAEGPAYVTGVATCEGCVAVISNNKVVETFDRDFQRVASTVAIKRATSVQVTDKTVVISDKAGDAYSYSTDLTGRKYLLGHVSVVMDMILTPDLNFLITCDRDEKIRISHFPNCYNIHSYLLGHQEYVLKILLLSPNLLLSVGGDQKLILWDLSTSQPVQTLPSPQEDYITISCSLPYILACNTRHVTVYKLTDTSLTQTSQLVTDHDIVDIAASDSRIALLTREPKLEIYQFSEGVMSEKCEVEGEIDLSQLKDSVLPEKKKVVRTAGFAEYFERKRKRIEEENLKEESKQAHLNLKERSKETHLNG